MDDLDGYRLQQFLGGWRAGLKLVYRQYTGGDPDAKTVPEMVEELYALADGVGR